MKTPPVTPQLRSMALTLALPALLVGCRAEPDYTPIGDGLRAIGICLVVSGIVTGLAESLKGEQHPTPPPGTDPPRRRPSSKRREES